MRHSFMILTWLLAVLCDGVSCGGSGGPSRTEESATRPPATPLPPATRSEPTRTLPATAGDVPSEQYDRTVYDEPFDGASRILIKATYTARGGSCCSTVLRVLFIDRADATKQWAIDTISEDYEFSYEVKRIESSAVLLCRTDAHGREAGCVTLFMDPVAKRLLNRVSFDLSRDVSFANNAEAQRLLGVSSRDFDVLGERNVFRATLAEAGAQPQVFAKHPLPQSTYQEFARARPSRVRDGYRKGSNLEERVGAWQADESGFWFAKTFYDGEGTTGVGGVGFLSAAGMYSFLRIPELFDWSV